MIRRWLGVAMILAILGSAAAASAGTEQAPTPLTPKNNSGEALEWTGTLAPRGTDSYWFVAKLGTARSARATTWIHWGTPEDLGVSVRDASGQQIASSNGLPGEDEIASFTIRNGQKYEVRVAGGTNAQTAFQGFLWVRSVAGRNFAGPGKLTYKKKDLFATIDVPINIVFAGFDKAEVDANKQAVLDRLPPAFRPVIRIGSNLGGSGVVRRDGGSAARGALYPIDHEQLDDFIGFAGSAIVPEPIEYRYKYNFITTPESYNKQLFAAAKAATKEGEYQLAFDREFIERYNGRAVALRGPDHAVAPGTKIDFVEGFDFEDWVAKHPPAGLDFDLSKPANGYTFFVVDSFRPSYAKDYFNPNRYHNFRVMNELTTDPDSGTQNGFDWGRVWGGRYRFLVLDVGAAPNGWEAPVTLANTKIFRLAANGDSSAYDPPIWHYQPSRIGDFYANIGEDVEYAIWMRFTRGYLYRPRAYDKFILATNTWHDADAYTPFPSKLEELYDDKLVLAAYRDLIPYATFDGFSRFKYLSKGDPEQDAIDEGKQASISRLPVPFAVNAHPTMLLIDRNRERYAPYEPGAFTVPVINVVFQSFHTWDLPLIVGGVAEGEGGEAWGQIQNVNDRTKTNKATGTVKDSKGTEHSPTIGQDPREEGVDNVARFGFTATALHEAGHFLGLSHTHDAVAYEWRNGAVDQPTGYYSTIDWMYTTTASPMGYGWEYNKFEVLDKDNTWIGHACEWLMEAQDALADAYAALDGKGARGVPPAVAQKQAVAEALMTSSANALKGGRYLDAVKLSRQAKSAAEATVAAAAATVLGTRVTKPSGAAPGGDSLPSTGVSDTPWEAVSALTAAAAMAIAWRRRRAF